MKRGLLLVLTCIALTSCSNGNQNKIERPGQLPIYQVSDKDAQMNAAIGKAKSTLQQFNDALESKNPRFTNFCLKVRYEIPTGYEHIWIADITMAAGIYFGVVGNEPDAIKGLKLYDHVEIETKNITDWMFLENGKLRGGYTTRLIRNRMTEQERKEADSTRQYRIED